jgi:hypothetical protein
MEQSKARLTISSSFQEKRGNGKFGRLIDSTFPSFILCLFNFTFATTRTMTKQNPAAYPCPHLLPGTTVDMTEFEPSKLGTRAQYVR